MERNSLRGPGYWRVDASVFKHFQLAGTNVLEFRIEVVNLFNHVNLGNPDSEVGVPGNDNTNAGRITRRPTATPIRSATCSSRCGSCSEEIAAANR